MKVILAAKSVYPFHPVGGVQKYVYYLAKYLKRRGIDLTIVAPLDSGKPREEIFEGLRYQLLAPSIYWYLEYPIGWLGVHLFSNALAKYLNTQDFDILHSFDMTGYQYLKTKRNKPVIAQIFTDNYLSSPISTDNPLNAFQLTASRFDSIKETKIAISPFADRKTKMKYWAQYYFKIKPMYYSLTQADCILFEDRIFESQVRETYRLNGKETDILPVGTDVGYIEQLMAQSSLTRKDIGFENNDIVLITVNRLAADKGIDKILYALAELVKQNKRYKLIIIGKGYQEKEILSIIDQLNLRDHIKHFKDVAEKDLYAYYRLADLFICAFSFPGSSISTVEAMACGLPIITTAQPWLVKGNGVYIQDNDPNKIWNAVEELVNEEKLEARGAVSRELVKNYDWPYLAEQTIEKYERILKNK